MCFMSLNVKVTLIYGQCLLLLQTCYINTIFLRPFNVNGEAGGFIYVYFVSLMPRRKTDRLQQKHYAMNKLYAKFLLMNTVATLLLGICVIKVQVTGVIMLCMLLYFGYLILAAMLFRKQAARFRAQEKAKSGQGK